MNSLHPDLKLLLRISRDTAAPREAPLGFATRVVARADLRPAQHGPDLQRSLAFVNWFAAALILVGVLYWQTQVRAPIEGQFAQTAQFIAKNLAL